MGGIFSRKKRAEPARPTANTRDSSKTIRGIQTASRASTSSGHYSYGDSSANRSTASSVRPTTSTSYKPSTQAPRTTSQSITVRPTAAVAPVSTYKTITSSQSAARPVSTVASPAAHTAVPSKAIAPVASTARPALQNPVNPTPIYDDDDYDEDEEYGEDEFYDEEYEDEEYEDDGLPVEESDEGIPVYMLSVTDERLCLFEPSREKFLEYYRESPRRAFREGEIYNITTIPNGSLGAPNEQGRRAYLARDEIYYGSSVVYRYWILPALLLGSRVRDFVQRCAVVDQLGTFVLTMPPQNGRLKELKLKTITGSTFQVKVKFVKRGKEEDLEKKWTVICHPPSVPLPPEVCKGSMLEIMNEDMNQPRVTQALMSTHVRDKKALIENWRLLFCIYGQRGNSSHPVPQLGSARIYLADNKGSVMLNSQQQEAVARYNDDACPGFVVESPPGSGKTMTAAAMAVSYNGDGVQLFLSTANVPVINMALALAKLDIGDLSAIHFISSEREEQMTEETRSPFSVLSLAKEDAELKEEIEELEWSIYHAPNDEEREKVKSKIRKLCAHIYDYEYDIFFATVDMILGRLYKKNQGGRHRVDILKQQLMSDVRRIVVDEASQLTESALNALILSFPQAQIVLIGDSKQLPPFKYSPGDVVSELCARSSLEVCKAKMNLPVTRLTHVYRASHTLMAHYSNVFYEGKLVSDKPESPKNPLSCFGARSNGSRCLFWKVKGRQRQAGTSKINDGEINSLKYIINILRNSGFDEKDVMIISYYEAQRKKAEEELPEEYEVLTVDSAQGREKKIVIVLTTRTSVPADTGAFFSCPLRCNVAVSRHQEALIVLGHNSIASAPNWTSVLSPKYFKHVEADSVGSEKRRRRRRRK